MTPLLIRTEIVTQLIDAFHDAANDAGASILDVLLAAHLFLTCVEGATLPEQRETLRQGMSEIKALYAGAPERFS